MALIVCKDCAKEFSTDTKACPNCGAKPPKALKKPMRPFMKWSLIALAVLLFVVTPIIDGMKSPEQRAMEKAGAVESSARIQVESKCIEHIRVNLKDPSSAEFGTEFGSKGLTNKILRNKSNEYVAFIEYRAKNGFGAYTKETYRCTATPDNKGGYTYEGG